ncbi:hypothetical protein MHH56_12370 [Paenibacillus sp. FSL K6-3182]|uniref:hypothetical protein n=1 Tax=unclassified Paenibacillus TaxID=185978 RepID=UPI0030CECAB5
MLLIKARCEGSCTFVYEAATSFIELARAHNVCFTRSFVISHIYLNKGLPATKSLVGGNPFFNVIKNIICSRLSCISPSKLMQHPEDIDGVFVFVGILQPAITNNEPEESKAVTEL